MRAKVIATTIVFAILLVLFIWSMSTMMSLLSPLSVSAGDIVAMILTAIWSILGATVALVGLGAWING